MVGQGFVEVLAQVPAQREAIGYKAHGLPFGAQILEEHHQLQLEEDHRVHRRANRAGVEGTHQFPGEREARS
jgi:hypothetical protein